MEHTVDFRIFLRSTTDWSMDNIWTLILNKLRDERPDLWNQFRIQIRKNPTLTRAAIASTMQAVGWTKDTLSFLPANLRALGDDMLSQSAGSIANYFLRQPEAEISTATIPNKQAAPKLRELSAELREYLRKLDLMNENQFPSDSDANLVARVRTIYELRNQPLNDTDGALLERFVDKINRGSTQLRKLIQLGVQTAEFDQQCLKYIDNGQMPESLRDHHTKKWEHENMFTREIVQETVSMTVEELNRRSALIQRTIEDGFHGLGRR